MENGKFCLSFRCFIDLLVAVLLLKMSKSRAVDVFCEMFNDILLYLLANNLGYTYYVRLRKSYLRLEVKEKLRLI